MATKSPKHPPTNTLIHNVPQLNLTYLQLQGPAFFFSEKPKSPERIEQEQQVFTPAQERARPQHNG